MTDEVKHVGFLSATRALAAAVREYEAELDNPGRDLTMRMIRRKEMFEALRAYERASTRSLK